MRAAITGNIAAGKSAVQKILAERGFKVLDADVIAHEILEREMPVIAPEIADLPPAAARGQLGAQVFSDPKLRKKLEALIHPQIKEILRARHSEGETTEESLSPHDKTEFVAVPLLFEAGMEGLFDKIILVHAPDDVRLKRLLKRNNYTREHALARMNSQMPQDKKIPKSDFVIENNSSLEELEKKVDAVIRLISV